jgi:hypothetical protein
MIHAIDNISRMPDSEKLRSRFQSIAMLDSILIPDWEQRYFSFNVNWGADEMMASMRNGEGDEYFFLFSQCGVVGKVLCSELPSTTSPSQILGKVPSQFKSFLGEPAFRLDEISFCLWQLTGHSTWQVFPNDINSIPLLGFVQDEGGYYHKWAEQYYERNISISVVGRVFNHEPLTDKILSDLSEKRHVKDLISDAREIGYPCQESGL